MGRVVLIGVQGSGQWAEGSLDAGHFREIARAAEALGYDSLWAGDHLSFENPILDPAVALATFAAVTERITLGTGVLLLALRPPGIVAKQYATLDFLCGGRLIVGVGAGGDGPKDFEAAGVPLGERGTRTDEGIEALRALWAEGARASFHGRFSQFDDVRIEPPPARAGGPPIVVGGRVPAALARAGRLADGWLAYMVSTERLAGGLEVVRGHARAAGRDPDGLFAGVVLPVAVHDDGDAARAHMRRHLSRRYGRNFQAHHVDRYTAAGDPREVRARLAAYAAAGAKHVVLNPTGPASGLLDDIELIADTVITPLREDARR